VAGRAATHFPAGTLVTSHRMADLLLGMVIMTVLAFGVCVGMVLLAYRKRNQTGQE